MKQCTNKEIERMLKISNKQIVHLVGWDGKPAVGRVGTPIPQENLGYFLFVIPGMTLLFLLW